MTPYFTFSPFRGMINMIFSKSHNSYLRMINGKEREIKNEEPIVLDGNILSATQKTEIAPE